MARYSRTAVLGIAQIAFVAAVIGLRALGGPAGATAYLAVAAYALFGRPQIVHALLLTWFFTFINPALAEPATGGPLLRYVVFSACALSIIGRSYTSIITLRLSLLTLSSVLLGAFLICHSLLFSLIPGISILKSISFVMVATTLLATWASFDQAERNTLEAQVFGSLLVLIVASGPLIATEAGYNLNGRGFQGLLSHPQSFGPVTAFASAWLIARMITAGKPPFSMILLLGVCLALGIASQARVGFAALLIGVSGALIAFRAENPLRRLFPAVRSGRVQLLAFSAISGVLLAAPVVYERALDFAFKSDTSAGITTTEALESSRGGLVYNMLDNIERSFWTGIGFGVASRSDLLTVELDPTYGLPVAAAVEKGVLPVAVMEELGPAGVVWVFAWMLGLFRRARATMGGLAVFLTCLASNLAEATFFSAGGMGLLVLNLCAWAATFPDAMALAPASRRPQSSERGSHSVTDTLVKQPLNAS